MEKLSTVVIIPAILSIAIALLVSAVFAQTVVPDSKVTYSFAPVSGGGCQIDSVLEPGEKAHFNFEILYEYGEPAGNFHLIDQGNTTTPKLKVHSESLDTLTVSGNTATFAGTATVNGTSGYSFTAYLEDNGEPGKNCDYFAIDITGPGLAYSASGTLKKGNIEVYGSAELPVTNLSIMFDGSGSYDPDGYINVYRWDFDGDGTWDIEGNVVKVTHSYNVSGNYTAILQVEDNSGNIANNSINITIRENEEEEVEDISDAVSWDGNHTFGGLYDRTFIGRFQPIVATASEIINNMDTDVNVTVELRVDGVLLNWNTTTLGPYEQMDIPVFAVWVPMSSGVHFVSLHVSDVSDWKYNWVGLTNDPTAGITTFIEKVMT